MNEARDLERMIIRRTAIALAIAAPVLAAVGLSRIALGGFAGAAFGIGGFHLLEAAIAAALTGDPLRAPAQLGLKYLARYSLTAVVLYAALRVDLGVFLGTAAGMIIVKLVILLTGLFGPM